MRAMPGVVMGLLLVVASAAAETELNRILATVDGEPITAHELDRYAAEMGSPDVPRAQLLDTLIMETLLAREAAERKIEVTEADVDAYVAEVQRQNRLDDEAFEAALREQGLSLAKYRARIEDELLKTQLVNQAIRARVNVPDEEVERHYEAHKETYRTSGGRVVRDIFLPVPPGASAEEAAAVEARAREIGTSATSRRRFEALAREHSRGPGAEQGGLLGTFGPGEMQDEFDRVVFALDVGTVSDPVPAGGGFHVFRVDDEIDAGYRPLEDVEEEIRENLYRTALEERYRDWLAHDLREAHDVEVLP